jgi:hypothetical protein
MISTIKAGSADGVCSSSAWSTPTAATTTVSGGMGPNQTHGNRTSMGTNPFY